MSMSYCRVISWAHDFLFGLVLIFFLLSENDLCVDSVLNVKRHFKLSFHQKIFDSEWE